MFYLISVPIATLHIASGQHGSMVNWVGIAEDQFHLVWSIKSGQIFHQKMEPTKGLSTLLENK